MTNCCERLCTDFTSGHSKWMVLRGDERFFAVVSGGKGIGGLQRESEYTSWHSPPKKEPNH